jgi:hypothetical protein
MKLNSLQQKTSNDNINIEEILHETSTLEYFHN